MIWSNILLQQKYLIAYTGLVSASSAGSWPYIFSLQLLFVNNTLYFSISSKTFIISKCLNLFYSSCLLSETNIAVVSSSLWPLRLKCSPTGLMIVLVFFLGRWLLILLRKSPVSPRYCTCIYTKYCNWLDRCSCLCDKNCCRIF